MTRSSRSKPAEELVELPEEDFESEEDADYSGEEGPASASDDDDEDDDAEGAADPEDAENDEDDEEDDKQESKSINPYKVLGISKDATQSQIKKVYHKAALKHHPDKVPLDQREEADVKFKEIAMAYGILSDEKKRKLYDSTGRTDGEGSDFDWSVFMATQYKAVINQDVISNVRSEYINTDEERDDVLAAYQKGKGNWSTIFENVMFSVMLNPDDESRFRTYIDEAISNKTVKSYNAYNESSQDRAKRLKHAEREAKEAEQILKKLNVKQDPSKMSESELGVLIRSRRPDSFAALDKGGSEALARHFEEKYGGAKKMKKKKRKQNEVEDGVMGHGGGGGEPSEEEFLAARERIKQRKQGRDK